MIRGTDLAMIGSAGVRRTPGGKIAKHAPVRHLARHFLTKNASVAETQSPVRFGEFRPTNVQESDGSVLPKRNIAIIRRWKITTRGGCHQPGPMIEEINDDNWRRSFVLASADFTNQDRTRLALGRDVGVQEAIAGWSLEFANH